MSQNTSKGWRLGARATALLTVSVTFLALASQAEARGAKQATEPAPLGGNCTGVRLAPHTACVSSYWVNAGENWLIAAEDEAVGGPLCVYLSRASGNSYAWGGGPAICNNEPAVTTQGTASGRPTVYNGSNHWVTAVLAVWH